MALYVTLYPIKGSTIKYFFYKLLFENETIGSKIFCMIRLDLNLTERGSKPAFITGCVQSK